MKYLATIVLACFALCQAMTTTHHPHHSHGPRPSHEPNEMEQTFFSYNHVTQNLLVKSIYHKMIKCYVATLSDSEKVNVHTDTGLRAVELKAFAQLAGATPTTPDMLNKSDVNFCSHGAKNRTVDYFML